VNQDEWSLKGAYLLNVVCHEARNERVVLPFRDDIDTVSAPLQRRHCRFYWRVVVLLEVTPTSDEHLFRLQAHQSSGSCVNARVVAA
jgi:hypothetical protein